MKIKNGFELKEIAESFVVIPVSENVVDFSSVIMLNETSAFLWLMLEKGSDEETLVRDLLKEYDVDERTAKADVSKFIEELKNAGVLES